jgi:hypothetical protein
MSDKQISRREALLNTLLVGGGLLGVAAASNAQNSQPSQTVLVVDKFDTLAETKATTDGMIVYLKQHTSGGIGGGYFQDTAGTITNDAGSQINNTITLGRHWKRLYTENEAHIENFGGVGDGVTNNDAAFLAAKNSLRRDPQTIQKHSGSSSPLITAYASGTLKFGRGVYVLSKNVMRVTQEMGLIIQGQGSRGNNLSVRGATVLLCKVLLSLRISL